ncbi:MAG: hypothetical protein MSH18_08055 [Bacteroidales bacterium]|nr:hypothetical protein [Bacteroidales bacterium]
MAYDINVALERLEKNLQNLQSAKEQVESTVSANAELQKIVSGYVASVKSILEDTLLLKQEVATMKSQKIVEVKEAVDLVEKLCSDIIGSFRNDTKESLRAFNTENGKLSQAITELQRFQIKLEKSIEVSSSVDTKLDKTSQEVLGLQSTQNENFASAAKQLESEMEELAQSISNESQSLSEQLSAIKEQIEKIDALGRDTQALCNQIDSNVSQIQASIEGLQTLMAEQHEETLKNININRWILIAGIVVLATLHFLVK